MRLLRTSLTGAGIDAIPAPVGVSGLGVPGVCTRP